MELIHQLVEAYAGKFTSPEDALLADINTQTLQHHPHAHMLSGHVQGRFLSFISNILRPKYVLEIGTFTGYSALCLAERIAPLAWASSCGSQTGRLDGISSPWMRNMGGLCATR